MHSLPKAFIERITHELGDEGQKLLDSLTQYSEPTVRLNSKKLINIEQSTINKYIEHNIQWCTQAYNLKTRPIFTLDPMFHAGQYYVQEAASMFISHILKYIKQNDSIKVLDLCAAPGGKSTLIADHIGKNSILVSNEIIRQRANILKENIIKWGRDNIIVTNNSSDDFKELVNCFDIILVDAPCSGEGMFRKDDKAIEEWSENNLKICEERQKVIIDNIWSSLKPNGILIYSTCTYNPKENQKILEWILNEYNSESIEIEHNFTGISKTTSNAHCYNFYPHKTKGEGFFIGVIRKKSETNNIKQTNLSKKTLKKIKKQEKIELPKEIFPLIHNIESYSLYKKDNIIGIIPSDYESFSITLENSLNIIYKGCELIEIVGKKYNLQHSLSMWIGLDKTKCTRYELDETTALKFLRKDDIPMPNTTSKWLLITHLDQPLGWCKNLGNRLNNYYPKEWRIKMQIPNL